MSASNKPIKELVWHGEIDKGDFGFGPLQALDRAVKAALENPDISVPGGQLVLVLSNSPIRQRHEGLLRKVFDDMSKATRSNRPGFIGVVCGAKNYRPVSEMRLGWSNADNRRLKIFPKRGDISGFLQSSLTSVEARKGFRARMARELPLVKTVVTDKPVLLSAGSGSLSWLGLVNSYSQDVRENFGGAQGPRYMLTDLRQCALCWSAMEDLTLSGRLAGDCSEATLPALSVYLVREEDLALARSFCDWVGSHHGGNAIAVSELASACCLLELEPDPVNKAIEKLLLQVNKTASLQTEQEDRFLDQRGDRCLLLDKTSTLVRRLEGTWLIERYMQIIHELDLDPDFRHRTNTLVDFRQCDNLLATDEMIDLFSQYSATRLARHQGFTPPLALICRPDQYRMFSTRVAESAKETFHMKFFQNVSQASAWLGIDVDQVIVALDRLAMREANSKD